MHPFTSVACRRSLGLVLFLLWIAAAASADTPVANWHFKSLAVRLINDGFPSETIETLYQSSQVSFETRGVSLYFVHSEAKLNYDQFTSQWSISQARNYLKKHRDTLQQIEQSYGVDKQVITAVILVETALGNTLGNRSILNTLSSLAALKDASVRNDFWQRFDKKDQISKKEFEDIAARKSRWAYNELKALLKYAAREKFDPLTIVGSYAGALGIAQFMPSTALAYARDGDLDGSIDLFNHADAMASIASFLKRYGWHPGIDAEKAKEVIYRYNHSNYYVDTILKIRDMLKG